MDSRNVCSNNCNCDCNTDYLPPCPPCGDIPLPPPRPCPPTPGCGPNPPGCSNHTPNYGLPLWKASDVTSWLMQMNGAMLRIDTILHDLALRTGINGLPDDLVTTVSNLCQNYEVLKCTVSEMGNKQANLELLMQNVNTQVSAMKTDVSAMGISITNFDTRLLSQESVTQAIRNDVNLIKSDMNMLNKTLTNLSSTFTQFQMTVSQQLAEHGAAIAALQNNPVQAKPIRHLFIGPDNYDDYVEQVRVENGYTGNSLSFKNGMYFEAVEVVPGVLIVDVDLPSINVTKVAGANSGPAIVIDIQDNLLVRNLKIGSFNIGIRHNKQAGFIYQSNKAAKVVPVNCSLGQSSTLNLNSIRLSASMALTEVSDMNNGEITITFPHFRLVCYKNVEVPEPSAPTEEN